METVLLLVLALLGTTLWAYSSGRFQRLRPAPTSVAVLPFENVTGDAQQEYFSQGVSDEIRSALARVPGLRVASRTSSYRHGSSGGTIREIADDLGVASVLEGSVQRAVDRVRITVSLVDARTDTQLWTQTFDRQLDVEGLFAVEAEVAQSVASALEVELGSAAADLTGRIPASLAAHDLYLLGLYYWNRRTADDLLRAVDFFEEAVARDPNYGLAYAGLANTHVLLPFYAGTPPAQAMPRARAAVERALAMDSTLAEAHAALAFVQTTYEWDWDGAETSFQRALALDPNYATAHEWYGTLLDALGRHDEARVELERAVDLDPLSAISNAVLGNHLLFVGEYDSAVQQLLRTLEIQPDLTLALQFLAETYILAGRSHDALPTLGRLSEITGSDPDGWVPVIRAIDSPDARADGVLALDQMAASGTLSHYNRAKYYALVGADQEALTALEQALEDKDFLMFYSGADPAFDRLAAHPRFGAILASLGLPQPSSAGETARSSLPPN